jgi:hypothetical protein
LPFREDTRHSSHHGYWTPAARQVSGRYRGSERNVELPLRLSAKNAGNLR